MEERKMLKSGLVFYIPMSKLEYAFSYILSKLV